MKRAKYRRAKMILIEKGRGKEHIEENPAEALEICEAMNSNMLIFPLLFISIDNLFHFPLHLRFL